jgi:endonuclease/exonuclease/phosphatase family metal-dependent hydrolase
VQKEQTAVWPEACSSNYTLGDLNSSAEAPKSGLGASPLHQTTRDTPDPSNAEKMSRELEENRRNQRVIKEIELIKEKRNKVWNGIRRKQRLRLATLNINGRKDERKRDKWPRLVTTIRSQGIAITGIQEAHLNEEETGKLNERFQKVIVINNGTSTAKEGIAFVLNKDLTKGMKWNHTEIIEGRALRLEIETEKDRGMNIILIYAPNEDKENIEFWAEMNIKMQEMGDMDNLIIMGDFNRVESALDRYPHREEDNRVRQEWKKIKNKYKIIDGWRAHNPTSKRYMFMQKGTGSMSRIDRIYMNKDIYPYGYNWSHLETGMCDHNMTIADILKAKLPFIGEGVWRMY